MSKKRSSRFPFFYNLYYFILLAGKWVLTGRKDLRYYAMERLANMFNPHFHFTEFGQVWRDDKEFENYYVGFEGDNFHSLDRKYTVNQFLQLVKNIPGDTVECGSFTGGTSYLICQSIATNKLDKKHHIFDSFEGLSKPAPEDGPYWKQGDLTTSEDVCRSNLSKFDFVQYYKGWIPDRFAEVNDVRFSFVHVDVDLYQPTYDSIAYFYDRLHKGGIIICDDYGFYSCEGAKKAMDDFFREKKESVVMLTTGQSFIIKE
ncbi:MAG TPA: TylF/MycF/NovP-related O-methyltransferase [Ferruginibacter sp.]|nr:TylF/MycF/NovP-related O-methyltransferase [Ferruginibacter sp.]